jgi:ADP-ribosylglycohydrolase
MIAGVQATAALRVEGALLGLSAGDRNGGPIRMALRLAESLAERTEFDLEDLGRRYLAWWKEGAFDTGPVAARVLELVAAGSTFGEASRQVDVEHSGLTAGCNPAHRCAPLAMCAAIPDDGLPPAARQEARLTHCHPLAGDVAAAVVVLCRALIRGVIWQEAVRTAAHDREKATRAVLQPHDQRDLQRGGFAPQALAAAVFFVETAADFEHAVQAAVEFAGPANYCPVLAGVLAGARWGASKVPEAASRHCALSGRVREVTRHLALHWAQERSVCAFIGPSVGGPTSRYPAPHA